MSAASKEKESKSRSRLCFDRAITHLRAGTWSTLDGAEVGFVGMATDLHGPNGVCTCCPRQIRSAA